MMDGALTRTIRSSFGVCVQMVPFARRVDGGFLRPSPGG